MEHKRMKRFFAIVLLFCFVGSNMLSSFSSVAQALAPQGEVLTQAQTETVSDGEMAPQFVPEAAENPQLPEEASPSAQETPSETAAAPVGEASPSQSPAQSQSSEQDGTAAPVGEASPSQSPAQSQSGEPDGTAAPVGEASPSQSPAQSQSGEPDGTAAPVGEASPSPAPIASPSPSATLDPMASPSPSPTLALSAQILGEASANAAADASDWNIRTELYWLENGEHYQTLSNVSTNAKEYRTLVYVLEVSTQKEGTYDPYDIEIRIPRALKTIEGTFYPTISIPSIDDPALSGDAQNSYCYYTEKAADGTEMIVVTNHKTVAAGNNTTMQMKFRIESGNFDDCQSYSFVAKTTTGHAVTGGDIATHPDTQTITYLMDNGVRLWQVKKDAAPLYTWSSAYGTAPENFDPEKFNYVLYKITGDAGGNQDFYFKIEETPSAGGEIVYFENAGMFSMTYDEATNTYTYLYDTDQDGNPNKRSAPRAYGANSVTLDYDVVVAYPRQAGDNDGVKYTNDVVYTAWGADPATADVAAGQTEDVNDHATTDAHANLTWEDFDFSYTGALTYFYKNLNGASGTVQHLECGHNVTASFYIHHTINGYNYDSYKAELWDEDMYWGFDDFGDVNTKMQAGDYEIIGYTATATSTLNINITGSDISRLNGEPYDLEMPAAPFILQGKNAAGQWVEIAQITESATNISGELLYDKGYTGVKLISPDGLTGRWYITLNAAVRVLPSKANIDALRAAGQAGYQYLNILNFAGEKFYAQAEDGSYTDWVNPAASSSHCKYYESTGLADADRAAQNGQLTNRKVDYVQIGQLKFLGDAIKEEISTTNDTAHQKIDVVYQLAAANYYSASVPAELAADVAIQEGIFYDLLPMGMRLNQEEIIYASGTGAKPDFKVLDYKYDYVLEDGIPAQVSDVETIENFAGTGRQLVIFHVQALAQNVGEEFTANGMYVYNRSVSGFHLRFTASISWTEYRYLRENEINLMAFQSGDADPTLPAPHTVEDSFSGLSRFFADEADYQAALSAMADLNQDGTVDGNTYYSSKELQLDAVVSSEIGLSKFVKAEGGSYSKHATVPVGGRYSYSLNFATDTDAQAKNVILYDVLENAYYDSTDGFTSKGETGDEAYWKGSFVGVDTSTARHMGIDVKVYYATALTLSDDDNSILTAGLSSPIWSTTCPTDRSTVTAIAFDMSKATDGSPYIFGAGSGTIIEILMNAPAAKPAAELAYNKPAYTAQMSSTLSNVWNDFDNICNRVTVDLASHTSFTFTKLGETGQETTFADPVHYEPVAGIQFRLYCGGTSERNLIQARYSLADGSVTFPNLEVGETYYIKEILPETGHLYDTISSSYGAWKFVASENPADVLPVRTTTSLPNFEQDAAGRCILKNSRTSHSMTIQKIWADTPTAIDRGDYSLTYIIYRDGAEFHRLTASGKDAWVTMSGLYTYAEDGHRYAYTFAEAPLAGYESSQTQNAPNYNGTISCKVTNTMLGRLEISKTVDDAAGMERENAQYPLTITLMDGDDPISGQYTATRTITTEVAGVASETQTETKLTFAAGRCATEIAANETITLVGLPVGVAYTIAEATNAAYGTSYQTATILGSDKNILPPGGTQGNVVQGTVVKGAINKVAFTNLYPTGDLTIRKAVAGDFAHSSAAQFAFTLTLAGGAPNASVTYQRKGEPLPSTLTLDAAGGYTGNFTLGNAGEVTFANLPLAMTYSITEASYANIGYLTSVSLNGAAAVAGSTASGRMTETVDVAFTNTKNNTEVSVPLTITKALTGTIPARAAEFGFALTALTSGAPLPAGASGTTAIITRSGAGRAEFADWTFDTPGSYRYQITERAGTDWGYTYDASVYTVLVEVAYDSTATLVANVTYQKGASDPFKPYTSGAIAFTNDFKAGGYTLTKHITGEAAEKNQHFAFTLDLAGQNGTYAYTIAHDYGITGQEKGSVTLKNGKATLQVELSDAECLTFAELPLGTVITATETIDPTSRYITSVTDAAGNTTVANTITTTVAQGMSSVSFENNRDHFPTHFQTVVEKKITGAQPLQAANFEFILTAEAGAPMPDGTSGTSLTITQTGAGDNTFGFLSFDQVGTYCYTIQEAAGSDWGYTYDDTVYHVVVTVSDAGSHGELFADVAFYTNAAHTEQSKDGVVFTNHFEHSSLSVTKSVSGNAGNQRTAFPMEVTLTGLAGEYAFVDADGTMGTVIIPASGSVTKAFSLRHGESVSFPQLPKGTAYQVTEQSANQNGYITSYVNDAGVLDGDGIAIVKNHRDYTALPFALTATKTLAGSPLAAKDFTFVLTAVSAGAPMPAGASGTSTAVTITGAGEIDFGEITYTEAGEYRYQLAEKKGSDWGYTYDDTIYALTVTVSDTGDDSGTLKAAATVTAAQANGIAGASAAVPYQSASSVTFHNTFTSGALTLTKAVAGDTEPAASNTPFDFTITLSDLPDGSYAYTHSGGAAGSLTVAGGTGNAAITLTNGQSVSFAQLPLGASYQVTEASYATSGYLTSVSANGAAPYAQRSITGSLANDVILAFTNTKNQSEVRVPLTITKELEGMVPSRSAEVNFEMLALSADAPMPANASGATATAARSGAGKVDMLGLVFDTPGNYRYKITEAVGSDWGYAYDASVYYFFVDVSYDTHAELVAKCSYLKGTVGTPHPYTSEAIAFTNEFAAGSLSITKAVTGNDGNRKQAFDFTLTFAGGYQNETYPYTHSDGTTGEMQGGSLAFTLKDGESITFAQLPLGMSYTVVETAANKGGYKTTSVGAQGVIAEETAVSFRNHREKPAEDLVVPARLTSPKTADSRLAMYGAALLWLSGGWLVASFLSAVWEKHHPKK